MKFAPIWVEPPAARLPFQLALVTVMFSPLCDQLPLQPSDSVWFPEYEYPSVQLVMAEPLLVIVTASEKPVPQSLLTL